MIPIKRRTVLRLQIILAVLGFALIAWAAEGWMERAWFHAETTRVLAAAPEPAGAPFDPASFTGLIEIPRLHFSEAFAEGDDEGTLRRAIGHLPDTPFPWEPGNAAFAGHRDGEFRPLRDIAIGDEIHVRTPRGMFLYRVRDMFVVMPDDVWVLSSTPARQLTLVTCYPFVYIGRAPKRFVVKADPVE